MDIQLDLVRFIVPLALRILTAVAIFYLGRAIANRTRPGVARLLQKPQVARTMGPTLVVQVGRLIHALILGASIALALIVLGVPATYVVGAVLIFVVILGVAMQESLANLAATIIFYMYDHFRQGELIQTMGYTGVVQETQLFNVALLLADQRVVTLPSQKVQESGVVNFSRTGILRADMEFPVGYGADLDQVRSTLLAIAAADARTLAQPPADVYILEMSETGVRVALRVFVKGTDYWQVLSDMRRLGKSALVDAGIGFAEYKYALEEGTTPPPLPAVLTGKARAQ